MDRTEMAIRGQGARLIDARQVRDLILAASKAFKRQASLGLAENGETFDAWRKAQLWDAARKNSFRAVTQSEFAKALNHFEVLEGAAVRKADPEQADQERRARWKLNRLLADAAVNGRFGGEAGARAYAESLFRKIHRTSLADADARQIWQVFFTLNGRAKRDGDRKSEDGGRKTEDGNQKSEIGGRQ